MISNKKAFTLIELLVVIAIIGILATISVIALNNARAKGRDAKRVADVKQVQTALELFFNDNNRYPTVAEFNSGSIFSTSTNGTTTYMTQIPIAPNPPDGSCSANQNTFGYAVALDGTSYTVSYCLGNITGALAVGPKCATPSGIVNVDCTPWTCGNQVTITTIAGHTCNTSAPDYDTCTYNTVLIGTQCWMSQSMNIGAYITGTTTQTNNSTLEKYCYGNSTGNCLTDGGIYQWDEVMQYSETELAQGVCPTGWHVPSDAEQNTLDQYLNDTTCDPNRSTWGCANAGTKLKVGGTSNFVGILAGLRHTDGSFIYRGSIAYFWSSSISGSYAYFRSVDSTTSSVYRYPTYQDHGFSVRCLQN